MFNLSTKPVSAGELMKKEKKPINFVVEKFISQGVHFLAGHPKSGKSWLSLWLALCVSNGNDLWGFKTNKSKVLYFCLEDTENRIQDRLEGMPGCDTDNLLFMYDAPNMDNGFDVFLKKIVKEEPEIELVIVDTFQLIRGEQFAGNAYACEYAEMNYLKKLAKELDITIILVHHLRKMHDSSPQNMISGSTALAGGADTTFVLYTFPKRKGYGILYCKGRDTDIREIELRFGFGTHIWEKISDSVEDSEGMKMVEIMTKLLDESGPFSGTATELCKLIKEVCDVEFTAPILGKKLADNKEFLKDFKINYESVRDMHQRTQKLWFDPDRIKNDSAEENSADESNSVTEIDDKATETSGGDDDVILKTGIDLTNNVFYINHTVTTPRVNGKLKIVAKDRAKTKSSLRALPLDMAVKERLLVIKERQEMYRKKFKRSYNKDWLDYVMVDELGGLIMPNYVTSAFKRVLTKNDLRPIRFHDLRHTSASLLLNNGVQLKDIQMWLGHSDFATTANIYAHLDASSKTASLAAIAGVVTI